MAPGLDPATHGYPVVGNDSDTVSVARTTANNATPVVKLGGVTYPLSAGAATVPVNRGSTGRASDRAAP